MPRLPRGMFSRGRSYYVRLYSDYRERWICLGSDLDGAKAKLRKIRQGEEPAAESRLTVSEAAKQWLKSYVATARCEKGQKEAEARVERYLERFLGSKQLSRVTTEDLRAFRLWLERNQKRKLRPATVAYVLTDARCFLRWAEESGLIDRAPIPRKLLPRIQEQPPDRLSDEEIAKLLALPEPYGFVIRFALGTGLRWSELCRAQASDVENGLVVVHQTKSGRVRRVPVPQDVLSEIRSRVGRLVPFASGSPGSFNKTVGSLSGVESFHVHQLRHTCACRWLERGGSLAALQEILGHASVLTTQRYGRVSLDMVRREAERIAAV